MKVNNLNIRWRYNPYPEIGIQHTQCIIESIVEPRKNTIYFGSALCNAQDHFCKDTGRKISLTRALKNANLSKEERTKVWEVYRNMSKKPRW